MSLLVSPGPINEPIAGLSLTSQEALERFAIRRQAFFAAGIAAGDRVFIGHGNSIAFFLDLLAVWASGACAVPLDGKLTTFECRNLIAAARPRFFIGTAANEALFHDVLEESGVTYVESSPIEAAVAVDQAVVDQALAELRDASGDALILFTSGSTGDPKGVVHTQATLRAKWAALSREIDAATLQRSLCMLPTHFGHGLICNALFPWLSGHELFLVPPFSAQSIMSLSSLLTRHEITFFSSVPAIWQLALKTRRPTTSHLLQVFCGSAPLSRHLWEDIIAWCGRAAVRNLYGITETGSWIAASPRHCTPADGLIGTPWGADFKVMASASLDQGPSKAAPCRSGEMGHIWVQTEALMRGYLDRPDLTAEKIVDGWFCTGDIGLFDAEGQLFLKGRERDEINRGGLKIYPADIESVISSFTAVRESCSFGHEDSRYGQSVAVALVMDVDDPATLRDLYSWTTERLADYKVPTRWYLLEDIPKTDRGKINRANLSQYCATQPPLDMKQILGGAK